MTRLAQVSDLHFGSEDPATTETLIHGLNRARLDLVILSGDLTLAARNNLGSASMGKEPSRRVVIRRRKR